MHNFVGRTASREADNTFKGGVIMIDLRKYEFWFVPEVSIFMSQTLIAGKREMQNNFGFIGNKLPQSRAESFSKQLQQLLMK